MKLRKAPATVIFLALLCGAAYAQPAQEPKRVLVLYWYNKDYSWNIGFEQSFQSTLQSSDVKVEYYPEYLENNRFPGEKQSLLFREYLKAKYADRRIDVVIANSDDSLDFLLKSRAQLFSTTPIVFVVARHLPHDQLADGAGLTGIVNISTYRQNLDLALSLHPQTKHAFIISGTVAQDKSFETIARQELQEYANKVELVYLTDLSLTDLVAKTRSLPEKSVILHVWQQSRDGQGNVVENASMLTAIARSANAPIYAMNFRPLFAQAEASLNRTGVVGGYVTTSQASGRKAADIVLKIVNGMAASKIPVENAPIEPIFDWRELRRWHIDGKSLPPGSIIQFREETFWSQYKWHVLGVIGLIGIEALLIIGLLVQRARRAKETGERQQAQMESQRLAGQLLHLQEEERKRIAGELHDSLGQSLVIIKNRATMGLRDTSDSERMSEQLEEISATATAAIDEVHEIAHNLRPYELDRLGLVKALKTMVDKLALSSAIRLTAHLDQIDGLLSPAAETSVYRIAQEGLNNVVKHAEATKAELSVKQVNGRLILSISDNGKGINLVSANRNGGGFGLAGIAERARLLGGSMEVESPTGGGTRLIVTLGTSGV